MPELPEFEALARSLDAALPNRPIAAATVRSPSLMKTYDPPIDALVGDAFTGVHRRGKWLFLPTRGGCTLLIHLMIGGRLRRTDGKVGPTRSDALVIRFDDGADLRLAEIGSKKRSAAHLGPEPLDPHVGVETLTTALAGPPRQLQSALVDQRTVAGIGNAWSDETLHAARLTPDQLAALHAALRDRLADGIARTAEDNYLEKLKPDRRSYLRVHNRKGQPCPACQTPFAAIHFGERVTTYCPTCQSDGRVYADRRLSRLLK